MKGGNMPITAHEAITKLNALQLAAVHGRLQRKHGWNLTQCRIVADWYRAFLALRLVVEDPERPIHPIQQDLDDMWHEHLLDTRRYREDCQEYIGRFVDHDPNIVGEQLEALVQESRKLFQTHFPEVLEEIDRKLAQSAPRCCG